jgi:Flp pilus assembly protein TadD
LTRKIPEGIENLQRSIELNPTAAMAYQLLAMCYMQKGDRVMALRYKNLADLFSGP